MFTQDTYQEDIAHFNEVDATKAMQLLKTEDLAIIYIGRATCPYCRKFAKKLGGLAPDVNQTIYYVDSSNTLDPELSTLREDYDIVTVPGFIVRKNGEITVRCDSSTPENELLDMMS